MSVAPIVTWPGLPVILHAFPNAANMTRAEFSQFCAANSDWRIERTSQGDLHIMPPTGGESGRKNAGIITQLQNWSERDGHGVAFDSSTGFCLPGGAIRSPDAAWVRRERWELLSRDDREEFPPLAPDFVMELRSKHDRLPDLRAKLQEYVDSGVRLGWLIDPTTRRVEIYSPGQSPTILDHPAILSGDPVAPGFVLDLAAIW